MSTINEKLVTAMVQTDMAIGRTKDMLDTLAKIKHEIQMLMLTIPREDEECLSRSENGDQNIK